MKKFEYKLITINNNQIRRKKLQAELYDKFQEWGDEGWELVSMEAVVSGAVILSGANTRGFFAVFKKEKVG